MVHVTVPRISSFESITLQCNTAALYSSFNRKCCCEWMLHKPKPWILYVKNGTLCMYSDEKELADCSTNLLEVQNCCLHTSPISGCRWGMIYFILRSCCAEHHTIKYSSFLSSSWHIGHKNRIVG